MLFPTLRKKRTTPTLPSMRSFMDSFWDLDNFFGRDFSVNEFFNNASIPAVNIKDTTNAYEIEVLAPGLKKDEFEVTVENGLLCIRADHEESKAEKEDTYTRREFNYNQFERFFTLPENVKENSVNAKYENGVLKITLAKTLAKKSIAKTIKIA